MIGKYYAVEDMLTTNPVEKFGQVTLKQVRTILIHISEHYFKVITDIVDFTICMLLSFLPSQMAGHIKMFSYLFTVYTISTIFWPVIFRFTSLHLTFTSKFYVLIFLPNMINNRSFLWMITFSTILGSPKRVKITILTQLCWPLRSRINKQVCLFLHFLIFLNFLNRHNTTL